MKKEAKDNNQSNTQFNKWLTSKIHKEASLWVKIVFHILATICILGIIIGIFIGLIRFSLIFRAYISLPMLPWIYIAIYVSTIVISTLSIKAILKRVKHKDWIKPYLFNIKK